MHLKPGTYRLVFIGKWAVIDIGEEKQEGIDARVIKYYLSPRIVMRIDWLIF